MYMWDLDSHTKQMYEIPWEAPLLIDWVREERKYAGDDDNDNRTNGASTHTAADQRWV